MKMRNSPNVTVVVMRLTVFDKQGEIVGYGWSMFSNQWGNSKPILIKRGTTEPLEEGGYDLHIESHEIAIFNDTRQ